MCRLIAGMHHAKKVYETEEFKRRVDGGEFPTAYDAAFAVGLYDSWAPRHVSFAVARDVFNYHRQKFPDAPPPQKPYREAFDDGLKIRVERELERLNQEEVRREWEKLPWYKKILKQQPSL